MAKYFNYFPKTVYSTDNKTSGLDSVTNIIARFSFEEKLKENSSAFYKYEIKDSDTPEIIASKFYDNSERHWIVLLFNNIIDPQWDWPLKERTLKEYIDSKYSTSEYADTANTFISGLSWAKNINNVKSYYKVITQTTLSGTNIEKLEVDENTYNEIFDTSDNYILQDGSSITISISKEIKTYYEFENEENEKKRVIKLLKPEFVPALEKEFKKVVKQ